MAFAFEKLIVYQKAIAFADAVCTLSKGFPRGYFFLADQLNRAALSIAANIAEATADSPNQIARTSSGVVQFRPVGGNSFDREGGPGNGTGSGGCVGSVGG